jgi:hypothetical protein
MFCPDYGHMYYYDVKNRQDTNMMQALRDAGKANS